MIAINSPSANTTTKTAKYSQGFVFGRNPLNEDYARAVVERSCAAVVTLLQDVFALAEKTAFRQASGQQAVMEQNRAFRRLADIIRYRSVIEKAMVTAVTCAYAEMVHGGMDAQGNPVQDRVGQDNSNQIEMRISDLEKLRCERLDLMLLLGVDEIRDQATDRNRPLLFDLNAQLSLLFDGGAKNILCSPLSPATLTGGFIAGLMCADMDILSKKLLLQTFEQEFLSKLSVLVNSVILRLEQENLVAKRPVGFDEKNAGPIARVLATGSCLSLPELQREIDLMHQSLSSHQHFSVGRDLYELSAEDSTDSIVRLLSDVRYYSHNMQASVLRMAINASETDVLMSVRKQIAAQINAEFLAKKMPAVVKSFLKTLWPDVLFYICVTSGESSDTWHEAMVLQQNLLESVTPVRDAEKLTMLNQIIPGVVRSLRRLLEETSCRYEDTAAFLGELKVLHLQNVQQKLNADDFVLWEEISMDAATPAVEPILNEDELVCYGQMRNMMSLLAYG